MIDNKNYKHIIWNSNGWMSSESAKCLRILIKCLLRNNQ